MTNLLRNTRVYLAGPVEHDANATSWRNIMTERLTPYGVTVFDPLVKPTWLSPICKIEPSSYRKVLNGTSDALTKRQVFDANLEMRRLCLRMVSQSDWIICYLPIKFTAGTFEELYQAGRDEKPVLFCTPDGIPSTWVPPIFCTPNEVDQSFFPDWDTMAAHIKKLDSGEIPMDPFKWLSVFYNHGKQDVYDNDQFIKNIADLALESLR